MQIDNVSQPLRNEMRKTENAKKADKQIRSSKVGGSDRSEFSQKGQQLSDTKGQLQIIKANLSSYPELRGDKIAEVKTKIESGFYDSEIFIDRLADKLLSEFGTE
ncbi:MAG: flagellar biosynthesis anti-sigma factor FlgM [Chitinispirillaceae bacterium]